MEIPATHVTPRCPAEERLHRPSFGRVALVLMLCWFGTDLARAADLPPGLMTPAQLQALPAQPADHRIAYGSESEQFGELRLPAGPGPHPVVILVHGGCWRADFATLGDLAPMGDALKAEGIASWNVEYRRLFQDGGGWPNTFLDVGRAVDHVRALAPEFDLDMQRVLVVGHSAGGHLALWAAARHRLDATSELRAGNPLALRGAVNMAGTLDTSVNLDNMQEACAAPVVEALHAGTPRDAPGRYAQSSPYALLPLGVPHFLLWAEHDVYMPLELAEEYARKATAAGDAVSLRVMPDLGHFELASPHEASWPILLDAIRALLDGRLPAQ